MQATHVRLKAEALSVAGSSRIAKAFSSDGATGTSNLQLASSSRERDFFRWLRLPIAEYKPLCLRTYVKTF